MKLRDFILTPENIEDKSDDLFLLVIPILGTIIEVLILYYISGFEFAFYLTPVIAIVNLLIAGLFYRLGIRS